MKWFECMMITRNPRKHNSSNKHFHQKETGNLNIPFQQKSLAGQKTFSCQKCTEQWSCRTKMGKFLDGITALNAFVI